MKDIISRFGWEQFLTAKIDMLSAYDSAKIMTTGHKVPVHHGKVAEGRFREWLSQFLPKRYGVTSGFIISQSMSASAKVPHFDVIIYDQIESPILWVDYNPDHSTQGHSMAIPAEYVKCVIEVKSSFSSRTMSDAINHLKELEPLLVGVDGDSDRYKIFLPPGFFSYVVFFELRNVYRNDRNGLIKMVDGVSLRGFSGGVILRGEKFNNKPTASLSLSHSNQEINFTKDRPSSDLFVGHYMTDFFQAENGVYYGANLSWSESNFARFAFDIIARLNGSYKVGYSSSEYAFGMSEIPETGKNWTR